MSDYSHDAHGSRNEMNAARIIANYLGEHGDKYNLANSASIRVLAIDLQEALSGTHLENG